MLKPERSTASSASARLPAHAWVLGRILRQCAATRTTGSLKWHKAMAYRKVKLGWMTIKATDPSEPDYYVNGTRPTQYEKPYELMTESEQKLYQDFLSHQGMNDCVKKIEQLQTGWRRHPSSRTASKDATRPAMGPSVTNALDKKKKRKKKLHGDEIVDYGYYRRIVQEEQAGPPELAPRDGRLP